MKTSNVKAPSGRGVWWEVWQGKSGVSIVIYVDINITQAFNSLEEYVAQRAAAGCADCISAVLECPDDMSLQQEVRNLRG